MRRDCQYVNIHNQRFCENEASKICMCCGVPVCEDHAFGDCPFGGEPLINLINQHNE